MTEIKPKPEYLEPVRRNGGRWDYGFGALEAGDQLRVPRDPSEATARSGRRVSSAACCWRRLDVRREHIRFAVSTRTNYVLIERLK